MSYGKAFGEIIYKAGGIFTYAGWMISKADDKHFFLDTAIIGVPVAVAWPVTVPMFCLKAIWNY